MKASKVWFITGSSSGFGRIMTEHLLQYGHSVVATLRKPEVLHDLVSRYPSDRLLVVQLDVTQRDAIPAAFAKAREAFGRVDVVFNNAGTFYGGEVESLQEQDARAMFEVNFWGAAHVTREAVRFFREVNRPRGGRLLQVSSLAGIAGNVCIGHYSASKFALEGLTEALVNELDPAWNIKVTMLEPGPFRTEIGTVNFHMAPPHPAYADPDMPGCKGRVTFESGVVMDGDPLKACIAFEKVSWMEDPPIRFPLHRSTLCVAEGKGKSLLEAVEKYKDWSDDVYLSVA